MPELPPRPVTPGPVISGFVVEINPGPPDAPPGETISEVRQLLETNPGPPDLPPSPIVEVFVTFVLETNPGPPNTPPNPVISDFVHETIGVNPGPPNLLGIAPPDGSF